MWISLSGRGTVILSDKGAQMRRRASVVVEARASVVVEARADGACAPVRFQQDLEAWALRPSLAIVFIRFSHSTTATPYRERGRYTGTPTKRSRNIGTWKEVDIVRNGLSPAPPFACAYYHPRARILSSSRAHTYILARAHIHPRVRTPTSRRHYAPFHYFSPLQSTAPNHRRMGKELRPASPCLHPAASRH